MKKRLLFLSIMGLLCAPAILVATTLNPPTSAATGEGYPLEDASKLVAPSEKTKAEGSTAGTPVNIDSDQDQTTLSLETDSLISPYVGAVKKPERPDFVAQPTVGETGSLLDDYNLETGVGLKLNDQTRLNLGYRFKDSQDLFDSETAESLREEDGDVRMSIEFKLPF